MIFESYTLILRHDYEVDGTTHQIEEPLVIKHCFDRTFHGSGCTMMLNNMFHEMRMEALKRAENPRGIDDAD